MDIQHIEPRVVFAMSAADEKKGFALENRNYSLFKQKNRWGLTVLSVVICLMLSPMLAMSAFLPQIVTLVPVMLMLLLGYVGPISAAACTAVVVAISSTMLGVWGGMLCMLLLVPVVIIGAYMVEKDSPFWVSAAGTGVTMFASMGVVMLIISALAGTDVVTALSQALQQAFAASGALGDWMLSMMSQMGVLTAQNGSSIDIATIDAATREQLISKLVMMVDSMLRLEIPMQMATGSVAAGLLGQAVLRKGVLSRGEKIDYPPLRTWCVPKGWGRVLGATLAVLYVLSLVVPSVTSSMFYVFSGVFEQVFALQGIAAICYVLHEKGRGRGAQRLAFIVCYLLVGPAAILLGPIGMILGMAVLMTGLADQTFDFTHRRVKIEENKPNPFDPRETGGK
mgnify:FL=1